MTRHREADCPSISFPAVLTAVFLILSALGVASRADAQPPPDMPIQFKIIGKFYDPEKDKNAGGVNSFTVNVLKKTWILDIESSHTLQGHALGSSVLKKIYPPIMTFVGTREITNVLTDPSIEGKPLTLAGQLYVKRRMYRITTLEGPAEEDASEADKEPEEAADAPSPPSE